MYGRLLAPLNAPSLAIGTPLHVLFPEVAAGAVTPASMPAG
jgi:hypothetical protein